MPEYEIPQAILFDLDDTIIAHSGPAEGLWKELCQRYASLIGGINSEILLEAVEKAREWYWSDTERHRRGRLNLIKARREFVALAFKSLDIDNPEISDRMADSYSNEREEKTLLFSGAIDTLKHFRYSGIKLGMVTNGASDIQRSKIEKFSLEQFFDCITIEGEFGAGKPDASVFIHTLGSLGVSPSEAWMVGDDLSRDVEGAQKAGIYGIWVDWNQSGLSVPASTKPDRIISCIKELV